jgi:hypothetical protein
MPAVAQASRAKAVEIASAMGRLRITLHPTDPKSVPVEIFYELTAVMFHSLV